MSTNHPYFLLLPEACRYSYQASFGGNGAGTSTSARADEGKIGNVDTDVRNLRRSDEVVEMRVGLAAKPKEGLGVRSRHERYEGEPRNRSRRLPCESRLVKPFPTLKRSEESFKRFREHNQRMANDTQLRDACRRSGLLLCREGSSCSSWCSQNEVQRRSQRSSSRQSQDRQ